MKTQAAALYPQDKLEALVQAIAGPAGVEAIDIALSEAPADPRLHFLRGSVLAGERRYPEARVAIGQAVALAPDFAIARFQLGFLEFTSSEPELARATWQPLQALPEGHALRLFAHGLLRLVEDDVEGAIADLRQGMAANHESPPLNRDMQLLIEELGRTPNPPSMPGAEEPLSETQMLLRQLGGTQH